jgi:5-methylthioadenosine/S-adenosylhomocysteine deaminase
MARFTCTVEAGTVAHPERVAAGIGAVGMRATLGQWGWDVDGVPFGAPAAEVLARQEAQLDAMPAGGLVEGWVTLVGHDLMTDELAAGASDLARRRGVGITFHISPHPATRQLPAAPGVRSITWRASVLGPHVLLAHRASTRWRSTWRSEHAPPSRLRGRTCAWRRVSPCPPR